MCPLTIYKASAGSGKTFQLTFAFLVLLFKDPSAYKRILAVTFTNKAASEMKFRILERLHALAILPEGEVSFDLQLLMEETGQSGSDVKERAGELLVKILNDYSRFSVGTIDRFFQGVIRAFTREVGLPSGFALELDRDRILGEAIDRMFAELGEDKELLAWLLKFAESRIEDARSWNFRQDILNLGQELFSESYQALAMSNEMSYKREDLDSFIGELKQKEHSYTELVKSTAAEICKEIHAAGYSIDDFYRKSGGVAGYFFKAATGDKISLTAAQKAAITDLSKWISKNENDQSKISFIESLLQPALEKIQDLIITLNSVKEVSRYVYALGILSELSKRILDISDEKNLFLLSDASRLLKGLIGNNPTPFIYEKTGNAIDHIMLDEFQDTSVFQWENFKPLLDHTLSLGKENMVVGDVKQSIYRWRNSDWKILADSVLTAFPHQPVKVMPLNENWRSLDRIIKFNNSIFSESRLIIQSIISEAMSQAAVDNAFKERWKGLVAAAYDDVIQHIPEAHSDTGGYIKGELISSGGVQFKEKALERLPEWIKDFQDGGYKASDIAILVRTNREGEAVAKALMDAANLHKDNKEYDFNFVSSDSLFIDSSPAIRFILSVLKYLHSQDDKLNNLNLKYYYRILQHEDIGSWHSSFDAWRPVEDVLGHGFKEAIPQLKRLPLFEQTEKIIDLFSLQDREEDLIYIQAFQEIIMVIQRDEPGSLHDFLLYWDEFGIRKSVQVSEEQEAIQIITIHKSKGLQFKAVIIPFCNWNLTNTASGAGDTILWCATEGSMFSQLPVIPLKFKKDLSETLFASEYLEELIKGYVDNLNVLYVALTRAEEAMIIGIPEGNKDNSISNAGRLVLHSARQAIPDQNIYKADLSCLVNEQGFEYGSFKSPGTSDNIPEKEWLVNAYPVNIRSDSLRLRLKSNDYFLKTPQSGSSHLDYGNLMHEIFGSIKLKSDVESAVLKFYDEGLIGEKDASTLIELINEKINRNEIRHWFENSAEVRNEWDILSEGTISRPDRVMIWEDRTVVVDYKFGVLEEQKYLTQVASYMKLLKEMGYPSVEGYVWYLAIDKLIKVKA